MIHEVTILVEFVTGTTNQDLEEAKNICRTLFEAEMKKLEPALFQISVLDTFGEKI